MEGFQSINGDWSGIVIFDYHIWTDFERLVKEKKNKIKESKCRFL